MFTKEKLNQLRSCWVLPDGEIYPVPSEQHDGYLPDGYYEEGWENENQIAEVEKKCFRMSFGWGWDAPISQMTIACDNLTDAQKNIIKYLCMAGVINWKQIRVHGILSRSELLDEILGENN